MGWWNTDMCWPTRPCCAITSLTSSQVVMLTSASRAAKAQREFSRIFPADSLKCYALDCVARIVLNRECYLTTLTKCHVHNIIAIEPLTGSSGLVVMGRVLGLLYRYRTRAAYFATQTRVEHPPIKHFEFWRGFWSQGGLELDALCLRQGKNL